MPSKQLPSPSVSFARASGLLLRLAGAGMLTALLGGCAVVSVAGAAAGAAISVTGAVVSTGISVTGSAVKAGIDAVSDDDEDE